MTGLLQKINWWPIPRSTQDQVGQGSGKPDPAEDVPARGRRLGPSGPFPTQIILWSLDDVFSPNSW